MQAHIFLRILANVSMDEAELAMFDSARCKDRGTAASLKAGSAPERKDEGLPECRKSGIGMTRGGRNSIFHAIFDEMGRPMAVELTADNEYDRATAIPHIDRMPFGAKTLVADKGCDSRRKEVSLLCPIRQFLIFMCNYSGPRSANPAISMHPAPNSAQ